MCQGACNPSGLSFYNPSSKVNCSQLDEISLLVHIKFLHFFNDLHDKTSRGSQGSIFVTQSS